MKKFIFVIIFFLLTAINGFTGNNAGRVVYLTGNVQYSTNGKVWNRLKLLQYIQEGTCIKVGDNSEAALILKDRSQIRLKAGSYFCLKKSGSAPGEKTFKRGLLSLKKGALWFRNKRRTPKPLIETPVVTASIRGTEMAINVLQNKSTEVVVLEGKIKCYNDKSEAVITRGEAVKVKSNKTMEIVKIIRPENKVQWLLITPDIIGPKDREVSGKSKEAIKLAQIGMKYLANNNSKAALSKIKEAMKIDSNRAAVNVAMATVLQSFGKFNEAIKYAKKALNLDPNSVPALLRSVELYLGTNKIKKAERLIYKFKGREDPRIYLLKGYIALIKFNSEKAITEFKHSLNLKPDFSEAYLGLGLAEYYSGKIREGLNHMEYACLLNPLAAYPHYYLGKAIYGIGERENAIIEIRRAIQLDSNDPTPYVYLATIYSDTYRPGDAILALQKAIKLNNNRLATRSRFLLDQDRAAKNVSLSWSLSTMGLNDWAKSIGDEAVWFDPSNSGAYLFRATEAVGQRAIDAATLGDLRRASLLQPVNANTYITYTDYQSLLEEPEYKGSVTSLGGTDKTLNSDLFFRGGVKKLAFILDGNLNTTRGPKNGTGKWDENGYIKTKYAINENNEILFEGNIGHYHLQDLNVWMDGNKNHKDIVTKANYWSLFTGYHLRQSGANHLLIALNFNGSDGLTNLKDFMILDKNFHRRDFRAELLELLNFNTHKVSIGASVGYGYTNNEDFFFMKYHKDYKREYKGYFRDIWHLTNKLIFDYGIGYCIQDGYWIDRNYNGKEKDRLLPHAGLILKFWKSKLRIGYYHELQPNYLSGTIQPVEVAGFKKITGVYPGTWTKFYGIGIDTQWNYRNFTRIEFIRYERRFPSLFQPNPYLNLFWDDERDSIFRLSHDILITESLALSINGSIKEIKTRKLVSRRTDRDFGIKMTYVHQSGLILQGALWMVDQDTGKGYRNFDGDSFTIASFSLQKSFFNKKGLIYLNWENIFDEEYKYLIFEPTESEQLPWQNSRFLMGLRWNF